MSFRIIGNQVAIEGGGFSSNRVVTLGTPNMTFDQWYRCTWMRKGDTFYGYVDGVLGTTPYTLTSNNVAYYFDNAT
eukprot:9424351-Prorocentrum_lima.AAC.1